MKLQQLIRLRIGSFVLDSALLAYFFNISWLFFTMLVGLSMMQFSVTKWCLLEDILKKLGAKN